MERTEMVYAALIGECGWQDFEDPLRRCLPGGRATFFYHDPATAGGEYKLTSGIEDRLVRDYAST